MRVERKSISYYFMYKICIEKKRVIDGLVKNANKTRLGKKTVC